MPVGLPTQAPYGFDGRRRVCYKRQAFMEGPMAHKIVIKTGDVTVEAVLNNSPTAKAVWGALPITGKANTWGDEIYFATPVKHELEPAAREIVEMGDLGYWPPGRALCIFFGPTPVSTGSEIRCASAVNIIGRVRGDPTIFKKVKDGARIQIGPRVTGKLSESPGK